MPTRDVFFVSMVARVAFLFAIDLKEVALLPISLPDDRDLKGERTSVCHIVLFVTIHVHSVRCGGWMLRRAGVDGVVS